MILQTKQRKETKLRGSLQKQPNPQALQQAGLVKQNKKKNIIPSLVILMQRK